MFNIFFSSGLRPYWQTGGTKSVFFRIFSYAVFSSFFRSSSKSYFVSVYITRRPFDIGRYYIFFVFYNFYTSSSLLWLWNALLLFYLQHPKVKCLLFMPCRKRLWKRHQAQEGWWKDTSGIAKRFSADFCLCEKGRRISQRRCQEDGMASQWWGIGPSREESIPNSRRIRRRLSGGRQEAQGRGSRKRCRRSATLFLLLFAFRPVLPYLPSLSPLLSIISKKGNIPFKPGFLFLPISHKI